jgi:hypothetical protein
MRVALTGNILAFGVFAAAFALHIVGGATDQGWLFAIAVVLIFWAAIDFPTLALALSRARAGSARALTAALGAAIGVALTASALWAAADRSWQWWTVPLALLLVGATYAVATVLPPRLGLRLPGRFPAPLAAGGKRA